MAFSLTGIFLAVLSASIAAEDNPCYPFGCGINSVPPPGIGPILPGLANFLPHLNPPIIPRNIGPFRFAIPDFSNTNNQFPPLPLPQPLQPIQPIHPLPPFPGQPSSNICKTNNICGNVNITFDVRVSDISHCKANNVEPRQKVKNLLILASHYYNCLKITTKKNIPNAKRPGNEILNSVDGIANTLQNEWVIYLNRTKKYVDLNKYLPSNGDYFIINYVDSNKI